MPQHVLRVDAKLSKTWGLWREMSGLDALKSYGSDSDSEIDDNENSDDLGFHHDSKRSHRNPDSAEGARQQVLELPSQILSMFSSANHASQESTASDHQGRIRSFAHVPGNWATFVYIPTESSTLANLTETLMRGLPRTLTFHPSDDLHLSLSRTVCLPYHWIEPFTRSLRGMLDGVRSFVCHIDMVDVYTNDEKTRTFLGLKIGAGRSTLRDLVAICDDCLSEFSLPVFYKNPSFHISLCWCVGDVSSQIDAGAINLLQDELDRHHGSLAVDVKEITCKSGCKDFVFPLR